MEHCRPTITEVTLLNHGVKLEYISGLVVPDF